MNLQGKLKNGVWTGGIEWTRIRELSGFIRRGYTWNVIKGCRHDCQWRMPDGSVAVCYAKTTAESPALATRAYSEGFEHHYYHPSALNQPLSVKERAGIFMDSMSDFWGAWVPDQEQAAVIDVVRQAGEQRGHIFMSLTKAAPQLLKWTAEALPTNLWPGVSSPPDHFMGQWLTHKQRLKMLETALEKLAQRSATHVTWMSFEPLSQDYAAVVAEFPGALKWAVIGAASNGSTYYDPNPDHVLNLMAVLLDQRVPIFFKGNMRHFCETYGVAWKEEFPPV